MCLISVLDFILNMNLDINFETLLLVLNNFAPVISKDTVVLVLVPSCVYYEIPTLYRVLQLNNITFEESIFMLSAYIHKYYVN